VTETEDGGESAGSELAPVQGSPLHITLCQTQWFADRSARLRETFDSDLFRPPTLCLV